MTKKGRQKFFEMNWWKIFLQTWWASKNLVGLGYPRQSARHCAPSLVAFTRTPFWYYNRPTILSRFFSDSFAHLISLPPQDVLPFRNAPWGPFGDVSDLSAYHIGRQSNSATISIRIKLSLR